MIGGHALTGASNPEDYVNRYLQTVMLLGAFIDDKQVRLHMHKYSHNVATNHP